MAFIFFENEFLFNLIYLGLQQMIQMFMSVNVWRGCLWKWILHNSDLQEESYKCSNVKTFRKIKRLSIKSTRLAENMPHIIELVTLIG